MLKKFQKVSDWTQDHFGYNNFVIARSLRIAMIISFVLREVFSFLQGMPALEIIVIACSVMIIIKMEFISHKAEQGLRNKSGLLNSAVIEYAVSRIMMQLVALAATGFFIKHLYCVLNPSIVSADQYSEWKELFWDLFGMLTFFVAYFTSCTPKPYKPGKARKLIEDASNRVRRSMVTLSPKRAYA